MLPILPTPDLNQTLIRLSPEEQADPVSVLAELCDEYTPGEVRRLFDNMQYTAILDEHCNEPRERDTQFFFGDLVLKAIEACYLICRDRAPTKPADDGPATGTAGNARIFVHWRYISGGNVKLSQLNRYANSYHTTH